MHTEFDMPFNNANKNVLFLSHRHHYHPHFVVNTSSQQHPFVSASPPATRAKRRALQSYALKYETTVERINERKDQKKSPIQNKTNADECSRMLVPRYSTAIEPTLPKKCLQNRKSRETIWGPKRELACKDAANNQYQLRYILPLPTSCGVSLLPTPTIDGLLS